MNKLFFCIWLLIPLKIVAQNTADKEIFLLQSKYKKEDSSRVNQYLKIANLCLKNDSIKSKLYGQKAMQLAQKIQWQNGIAQSNFYLGSYYYNQFNYHKALQYFNLSIKTTDKKNLSNSLQSIGGVYIYKSDFSKALAYYHKALKIEESIKNKSGIAKISSNLGSIYFGIQNYSKALLFLDKATKMYQELKNPSDLAIVYRNTAGVYNSLNQPQKALALYEQAISMSKKTNNKPLEAHILSDIALVYFNQKEFDKAINYGRLSLKNTYNKTNDKNTLAFTYGVLGDAFIEKTKETKNNIFLDSAITHLNKALQLHKEFKSNRDLAYDYSSITKVYKLKGDYKNALIAYETAMVYEDSVFNFNNKETIKNLEDKRAIELRDKEIKINNLKLEAKEKQKWYFIFGLGLLGIIGGLLFYQNQNRKKTNDKLLQLNTNLDQKNQELDEANKIKARFFGILNHDLRSPVYNLIHFLHLQKENPELLDEEMKNSIQTKTMVSAENLLQSMEDMLLWSKGQMENFEPQPQKIEIAHLFDDTKKHFSSVNDIQFVFENPSNLSVITDENYLKTIVRNLTGNAVKALVDIQNPKIIWKAFQEPARLGENNKTIITITDNGKGASDEQFKALYDDKEVVGIKTGLGLHLIRDLAKAIDCEIVVESKLNEGTTITLKL